MVHNLIKWEDTEWGKTGKLPLSGGSSMVVTVEQGMITTFWPDDENIGIDELELIRIVLQDAIMFAKEQFNDN